MSPVFLCGQPPVTRYITRVMTYVLTGEVEHPSRLCSPLLLVWKLPQDSRQIRCSFGERNGPCLLVCVCETE